MEYIPAKTIITKNKSTAWFGIDYTMNIYRGCNHGCIYCDSRSDCYHNFDFDTVKAKENALEIIRNELRRKVRSGIIATGSMSDPYNPFEKQLELTRHGLELISAYGLGVAVATKSPLITRDADILKEISEHSPVIVKLTITTPDDELSRIIEPHVAVSSQRLGALSALSCAGVYAGVLLMPVLPWITDNEQAIITLLDMIKAAGGRFVYGAFGMTMRDGQREYFYDRLDESFPGMKEKYQKAFSGRYQCSSPKAQKLYYSFENHCNKIGLLYKMKDIVFDYKKGYGDTQLKFF